ncbi:GNAT family N-acetyltransferase [Thalassotalea sp. Y01]|uniref:GNAT family N-acetyltransferase n=1 Tax=Thalassotalea sp. Y01 TaxID=2729613 RepID=UPI00145F5916|nr:GNAT family N-acetyltransferase [Thalassotalea sp. Y01]NMP16188.1 GNAT family N-acetyltransferase [Thalassotalea sp. Y01]
MAFTVKHITRLEKLLPYRQAWEQLRQEVNLGFCSSFDWLYLWAERYLNKSDKLAVQLYYNEQKLVAVIPIYFQSTWSGLELFFLGQGESEHEEVASEFQDFLLDSTYQKEVFTAFNRYLKSMTNLQRLQFSQVLSNSHCAQFCQNYLPADADFIESASRVRYFLPVANYARSINSASARRKMLKNLSEYGLTLVLPDSIKEVENMYQQLVALHQSAWRAKQKPGAFSSAKFIEFHRQYIRKLWQQRRIMMFALQREQQTVGVFYGVIDGDILSYYQSGLDIHEVNNIGYVMHAQALTLAKSNGLSQYDLMAASSVSYKRFITSNTEPVVSLRCRFSAKNWAQRLLAFKDKLMVNFRRPVI